MEALLAAQAARQDTARRVLPMPPQLGDTALEWFAAGRRGRDLSPSEELGAAAKKAAPASPLAPRGGGGRSRGRAPVSEAEEDGIDTETSTPPTENALRKREERRRTADAKHAALVAQHKRASVEVQRGT